MAEQLVLDGGAALAAALRRVSLELEGRFNIYDGNARGSRSASRRTATSEYWSGKANGVLEALELLGELVK